MRAYVFGSNSVVRYTRVPVPVAMMRVCYFQEHLTWRTAFVEL